MKMTPQMALERLSEGNARFMRGETLHSNEVERLARHVDGQAPYAMVISCADSRVPVEHRFDAGIGELFVVRIAGNVATDEVIASTQFAVVELGTPLILVLGHSQCGAVSGALTFEETKGYPPQLARLMSDIRDGVAGADDPDDAIDRNVRNQLKILHGVPSLQERVESGDLLIEGGIYHLIDGRVDFFE